MPRLIDADALYKSFGASGNCNDCPLDAYKCQYYNEHTLMEFCERIDDAPTVDAEPVVRCKDCKHNQLPPTRGNADCELWYGMTDLYGYCHCGERREDAKIN